jgi:hypothetical protein
MNIKKMTFQNGLITDFVFSYNRKYQTRCCFDSRNDSHNKLLEIIIIFDASEVKSGEICIPFEEKDGKVNYV